MEPTYAQIKTCTACILMEAYVELIRPEITKIYNEVLDYHFPQDSVKCKRTQEIIRDYNALYRWGGDCTEYYKEVALVLIERGFKPSKPGCCPLLEAECALRSLQNEFMMACVDELSEKIGITQELLKTASSKLRKQFLELNMKYVSQFVDKKDLELNIQK